MATFNPKGDELCNEGNGHEFKNGICRHCSAPETEASTDKAIADLYAKEERKREGQARAAETMLRNAK